MPSIYGKSWCWTRQLVALVPRQLYLIGATSRREERPPRGEGLSIRMAAATTPQSY